MVRSTRLVSLVHRHLAVMTMEVTLLDAAAPVVISSQLINRQDGEDEYHVSAAVARRRLRPAPSRECSTTGCWCRSCSASTRASVLLGYRCANSGMTLACGYRHTVESRESPHEVETTVGADLAKTVSPSRASPARPIRIVKLVAYHSSRGVPAQELGRPLHAHAGPRASRTDSSASSPQQREWLDEFWERERRRDRAATTRRNRRCAGTCSSSPRPAPGRTSRASPPRG